MTYEGLVRLAMFFQQTVPYHRPLLFLWQGLKSTAIIQADDEKGEGTWQ